MNTPINTDVDWSDMRGYIRDKEAREFIKIMNHCTCTTPGWFIRGILFGLECCRVAYDPSNKDQEWNDKYFIDDRHPRSLIGGIKEAWLYLYGFDINTVIPCTSEIDQSIKALDYYRNGIPGQVKSGCVQRSGGAIEFDRNWLLTSAKELVVFLKNRPQALVGPIGSWAALVNDEIQRASQIDPDHYKNPNKLIVIDQVAYDQSITTITLPSHIQE